MNFNAKSVSFYLIAVFAFLLITGSCVITGCDFFVDEDEKEYEVDEKKAEDHTKEKEIDKDENQKEKNDKTEEENEDEDDPDRKEAEKNNAHEANDRGHPFAHQDLPVSDAHDIFTMERDFKIGDLEVTDFLDSHEPVSTYLEEEPNIREEQPTEHDTFVEVDYDGLALHYNIDVFQEGKGLNSIKVTGEEYSVSRNISPGDDIKKVLEKFPNKEAENELLYQDEETQTRGEINTRANNSIKMVTLVHQESVEHLPTSMQIYVNEEGIVEQIEIFFEI